LFSLDNLGFGIKRDSLVTKHSNTEDLLLAVVFLILLLFVFSFLNNSPALTGGITGKTVTELKDDTGAVVGHKIVDDPNFETRMVAIERTENLLRIRFSHNAAQALPVWVEGDVTHTFSVLENATPNDVVTLAVMLENNKVPKFKLHIGAESEIFEFGEEQKGFGTTGFHTQAFDPNLKRLIVIGIDGFQYNHYVDMLNAGNLTNFTRLMQYNGRNLTLNITGHTQTITAPGNAELHTGLNSTHNNITDNTCSKSIPSGNTTWERLALFNSSIKTGLVYGKQTCYVPDGILNNAKPAIGWYYNRTLYDNTDWIDGTECAYDRNVSTKAAEFIVNNTNSSFYLFMYFGTPDCSGHAHTDQSLEYNLSFMEIDRALGVLLDTLRDQGLENNTPIIITADHGWNTGTTGHSTFNADTAVLPVITNNISMIANPTLLGVRQQCDIAPTTLNYFGMLPANYSDIVADGCGSMYNPLYNAERSPNCTTVNISTSLLENVFTNASCFLINGSNLIFNCSGYLIAGNGNGIGINATGQTNVTIKDCLVENFSTNIWVMRTPNARILNTTAKNAPGNSIAITLSDNTTIDNTTAQSISAAGILFNSATNATLSNSTGRSTSGRGILLSYTNLSQANVAAGYSTSDIGFSVSYSNRNTLINITGRSNSSSGISFASSTNNTITNSAGTSVTGRGVSLNDCIDNNITSTSGTSNSTYGIALINSTGSIIRDATGNSTAGAGFGVLTNSNYNTLTNSRVVSGSNYGLYMNPSYNNNITNNWFCNTTTGLMLNDGDANNSIVNNTFCNNQYGIIVQGSAANNCIENNTFANNTDTGCILQGTSHETLVFNNTISNSTSGIRLSGDCYNNTVRNNTLFDNTVGILLESNAQNNTLENNTLLNNRQAGIRVDPTATMNTLKSNIFLANLWGIILTGGNANRILNSTLSGNAGSLNISGSGFNNTINNSVLLANSTFESQNSNGPTILTYTVDLNFSVERVFKDVMNLSYNRVFVNSSAAPEFNTSAVIKLFNLYFAPNPLVDIADSGTFAACQWCTVISAAPGLLVFNVSRFTTYSSNETVFVCGPNSNLSALANATFNGTYTANVTNSTGYDGLGYALSAGDLNNDTFKDIIVSAPFTPLNNETPEAGRVYVIYGQYPFRPGGDILSVSNLRVTGSNTNDLVGQAITAGDLNGDGIDDLVVGAPGNKTVAIFFGANGLGNFAWNLSNANVIINVSSFDDLALAVGDLNKDNITDLVIGEVDYPDNSATATGRVDVVFGRRSWQARVNLPSDANATFSGTAPNGFFGFSLTTGDLNNDSIEDLVIGAPGTDVSGVLSVGKGYVFFGTQGFTGHTLTSANLTFTGEPAVNGINNTYALAGFSIFARADVNNDTIKDLLIGAPRSNAPPDKEDAGTAYIVFGDSSIGGNISLSNANVTLYGVFGNPAGVPPGERAGYAVYARDINSDFLADVMVGAPRAHANALADAGIVYNIYGRNAWPRFMNLTNSSQTLCGQAESAFTGFSIGNGSQSTGDPSGETSRSGQPAQSSSARNSASGGNIAASRAGAVQDTSEPNEACPPEHDPECNTPGQSCGSDPLNPSTCTADCICPPPGTPPTTTGGGLPCSQASACTTLENGKKGIFFSGSGMAYTGEEDCPPDGPDVTPCGGAYQCDVSCVAQDIINAAKEKCCCHTTSECKDYNNEKGVQFDQPYAYRLCKQWPIETGSCIDDKIEQQAADAAYAKCCIPPDTSRCGNKQVERDAPYFEECEPGKQDDSCELIGLQRGWTSLNPTCADDCKCVQCTRDSDCPNPPGVQNQCWDPGKGQCSSLGFEGAQGGICTTTIPLYKEMPYLVNPSCSKVAPDPYQPPKVGEQAINGCELKAVLPSPLPMPLVGSVPITLFSYSMPCTFSCQYECFICPDTIPFVKALMNILPPNSVWIYKVDTQESWSVSYEYKIGSTVLQCPKDGVSVCATGSVGPGCPCLPPATGTYPNCQCPPGSVGTPPNCVCPAGMYGNPTNCVECLPGSTDPGCPCESPYVGTNPDCRCPPGMTGTPPNCVQCLPGSTEPGCPCTDGQGTWPDCPTCPPGTVGTPPNCVQCPPGSTDPQCMQITCEESGTCPPPECATPPCDTEPPVIPPPPLPPTLPPTIIYPPIGPPYMPPITTQPPVVSPPPPPPPPPPVYCQISSGENEGVTLSSSHWMNFTRIPEGYEVITALNVTCNGNYLDITINLPDNYRDVRAFLRYIYGGDSSLSSEVVSSSKCGDQFIETTRRQQITSWGRPNYTFEEMQVERLVQKVVAPSDAERIVQSGRYSAELINAPTGSTIVKISSPTFDVPPAAHPNLVIIGTPLLVTINPPYRGKVRITMPYQTPDFIDPDSLAIYVKAGGEKWKYLTSYIDRENMTIVAEVDDVSLFLDNANSAVFAVMGITCSSCKKVDLEKLYDGGSRKAVFLVHGFTTDKLRWQSFIDDMVHTNSDWQIWLVGYPLSMTSDDVAAELSSLIEEHASEFDKASFIMHSMGGIITQKALKLGNDNNLVWPKKVQDMILAGQPGLGSPSADIYGKLFAALVNLRSSSVVWSQRSPLLGEAVAGKQVPRSPDAEYFVIAGRQSYPFTYDLFRTNNTYLPNDGIISIFSARTVGGSQITDNCQHYFELPRTHTDLLDDWLSRKVMQRILFRQDAAENPEEAILGYNKYIHVVDDSCRSGMLIVIGKHMSEAETEDPLNCKCGNGVCGEGETTVNCPVDCVTGYKYYYICRVLPWFIGPLVALLVLLTTAYVYRAINRHERGEGALWISIISAALLMFIIGMYLFCGFTMPLAILVLVFVLALLGFTMGHLHAEAKGQKHKPAIEAVSVRKPAPSIRKPVPIVQKKAKAPEAEITLIDGNTIKKLEKLLNKARGR
jgi:parallel beta-helix repeat protein